MTRDRNLPPSRTRRRSVATVLALAWCLVLPFSSSTLAYKRPTHKAISTEAFALFEECLQHRFPTPIAKDFARRSEAEDAWTWTRAANWHFYNRNQCLRSSTWWAETFLDRIFQRRIFEVRETIHDFDCRYDAAVEATVRVLFHVCRTHAADMALTVDPGHVVALEVRADSAAALLDQPQLAGLVPRSCA